MPPFYFLTFAKVSVSVSKKFSLKKVLVSVSKTFGLKKKSRYRSRKYLVSKKSLGLGLENFGLEKKSRYRSRWNFLVSSLSAVGWSLALGNVKRMRKSSGHLPNVYFPSSPLLSAALVAFNGPLWLFDNGTSATPSSQNLALPTSKCLMVVCKPLCTKASAKTPGCPKVPRLDNALKSAWQW